MKIRQRWLTLGDAIWKLIGACIPLIYPVVQSVLVTVKLTDQTEMGWIATMSPTWGLIAFALLASAAYSLIKRKQKEFNNE